MRLLLASTLIARLDDRGSRAGDRRRRALPYWDFHHWTVVWARRGSADFDSGSRRYPFVF